MKRENPLQLIEKPRFEPHVSLNYVFCELIRRLSEATPISCAGAEGMKDSNTTRSCNVTEEEWIAIKKLIKHSKDPLRHLFATFFQDKDE